MSYFERLAESASRIALHADYPGKRDAIERCVEDIDDLAHDGRITAEQRDLLREILLESRLLAL